MNRKLYMLVAFMHLCVFALTADENSFSVKMLRDTILSPRSFWEGEDSYNPVDGFDVVQGNLRLTADCKTGSVCLYYVARNAESIPILVNEFGGSSSFFSVRRDGDVFPLRKAGRINVETALTSCGAVVSYFIRDDFLVMLDFCFVNQDFATDTGILGIAVQTVNLGLKEKKMSVKSCFDTLLGESTTSHFSTAKISSISREMKFDSMADDLWICSKGNRSSMFILLSGAGISMPSSVSLVLRNFLESYGWGTNIKGEKDFASTVPLNDTAVVVNWDENSIAPSGANAKFFYIMASNRERQDDAKTFLSILESKSQKLLGTLENKERINKEYVQSLIDYIVSIRDSGSSLDEEKYEMLNKELDEIIQMLGEK